MVSEIVQVSRCIPTMHGLYTAVSAHSAAQSSSVTRLLAPTLGRPSPPPSNPSRTGTRSSAPVGVCLSVWFVHCCFQFYIPCMREILGLSTLSVLAAKSSFPVADVMLSSLRKGKEGETLGNRAAGKYSVWLTPCCILVSLIVPTESELLRLVQLFQTVSISLAIA